jgi:aldose 1-epimerase
MTERFGTTEHGEEVLRVELRGARLRARVITWGAVLQDLRLDGHGPALVLGLERFEHYSAHSPHFGAIAGRCANRIGGARFTLDGREVALDPNAPGGHHLHGGRAGFGLRAWRLVEAGAAHATLEMVSPDGDMGYPGTLTARCTYRLEPPATLRVELEAHTDAPTLCNLAHHSYFNLDGTPDVLDHRLRIAAQAMTPVDPELIPSGEVMPVRGSPLDFRTERAIRHQIDGARFAYDHNFCLSRTPEPLRPVACVTGARSGVSLEVRTTEPGLQLYDGAKMGLPVPGLDGARYGASAGLCLEAQRWPDAPNHAGFPSAVLRPGERYEQTTEYRFATQRA